jgi:hypothetical protein
VPSPIPSISADAPIAPSASDTLEYLGFAGRQRLRSGLARQPALHAARLPRFSVPYRADARNNLRHGGILEKVATCTGADRAFDVDIASQRCQDDHGGLRSLLPDRSQRFDTIQGGHAQVEQPDVGLGVLPQRDRFGPVGCFTHDGEVVVR